MRVALEVPYADAAAEDLVWGIGDEPRAALAIRALEIPRAEVELRLLGASHQVVVRHRSGTFTETVACQPGSRGGLPQERVLDLDGGLRYAFSSVVTGPLDVSAAVASIIDGLGPSSLYGAFPGHPSAVTALDLTADERSCEWRTWHAYPLTGQIVLTESALFL